MMLELSTLEKEARKIHAEFEAHKDARRRLARRARKLANSVRRRFPNMHINDDTDYGLHDVVEELASTLHLSQTHGEHDPSVDTMHTVSNRFSDVFYFLGVLFDAPWLKGNED
ncbi:MAG: hypothetical protein DRQ40_04470 [Gammaproteobacteria bacterium]|nr:MAG: hypothetical protein DRQ40_04470 [Gammaproteobacteria bacterium]